MLGLGRTRQRGTDRLTLGLAGLALATAGTVIGGELLRLARRRSEEAGSSAGMLDTAEQAAVVAGEAAQDTFFVAIEGYDATPRHETVLFNVLSGFLGGFALMRVSTLGIRAGWWPFGNVQLGGRHIHHFVPGILLAFGSGAAGLITRSERLETALAVPFGAGIGLTFDEAALLLDLEDVYWTRQGLLSVQVSLGAAALLGATIIALRILRRGERRSAARGLIPARESDQVPGWAAA
ncbi:MAG: hypothetical protein K0R41_126 [Geminicoccaceae bacterium]|jgi:hypothetical protein|nr:hypothetical protein [Geminicoccaceae bacterium]MCE3246301.1 hypothetical protein [Geminicoccaceae bacterium]